MHGSPLLVPSMSAPDWTTESVGDALRTLHAWLLDTGQLDAADALDDVVVTSPITQADAVTLGQLREGAEALAALD